MNRINVLTESVYNKIAAGEVVEKPASIVKELVENSLDSGADEILVEVESGGINKIRVVDNGCGIHPDDVKSAFIIHATSKIKEVDDLFNIATLGFRGEALSSIASVSKLKMETKQAEFLEGKSIQIDGGIIKDFCDISKNDGTIVEVYDLFYNIPARKKFLRKPKTEENEITNLMIRYILANPKIKFSYVVDGKLIYKTNGTTLKDALYVVYKKDILSSLIEVDYSYDDVHIYGYISKPTSSKPNRSYQTLIINKRYVVSSMISSCVQNAYENLLMKGQFPLFVLNFDLPLNSVDVNVHPNKLEVKFENTQKIYGYFYSAISKALNQNNEIKNVSFFDEKSIEKPLKNDEKNNENASKNEENLLKINEKNNENLLKNNGKIGENLLKNDENNNENLFVGKSFSEVEYNKNSEEFKETLQEKIQKAQSKVYEDFSIYAKENTFCENEIMTNVLNKQLERAKNEVINEEKNKIFKENEIEEIEIKNLNNNDNKQNQNNEHFKNFSTKQQLFENIEKLNYKIVGSLFDTYVLIEINSSLFVFDQHACHERLNYDKLVESFESKNLIVQPLLVPFVFETNTVETAFIEEKLELISSLGFEISLFGQNCFRVSSVPSVISNINLKNFFDDILSDLSSLKKLTTENLFKEKLSQKACKASVKAGNKLSEKEIELLLELMQKNNMMLACPHGRPACIEITKTELEKWFKRKV